MANVSGTSSPNDFFVQLVWGAIWTPTSAYYLPSVVINGIDEQGVQVSPLGSVQITNVPPSGSFQLLKSQGLAHWLPVNTGYIGIQLSDILGQFPGVDSITNGGLTYTDDPNDATKGTLVGVINTPGLTVSGSYVLVATGLAECALDTAGALSVLPSAPELALAADAPTADQYLDSARAQRTRLWQTPNGGALMDAFYDHNEAYNYVFQNSVEMQNSWQSADNQTYVQQTYDAANNPDTAPVNATPASMASGDAPTVDYNTNAFYQQGMLTFAAYHFNQHPPADGSITAQQFEDASVAASNFGTLHVNPTGNTETQTTPMTVNDVFATVAGASPASPAQLLARPPATAGPLLTTRQQAYVDQVRARVQALTAPAAAADSDASATLIQGTFDLTLSAGQLTLTAGLTFPASGAPTTTVSSLSSSAQVTALNIHNITDWTTGDMQSIGSAIVTALEQSDSIRNLLADKLNDALGSSTVTTYLTNWLNTTLAKDLGALPG